ncbi:M23 family metallopeptidase [Sphingomonas nostoxanthinifaciens]|uniref:M23 family metallopeptidase n=1 Tax=Sphingomonas nostoxanthinifaciens TaxID=2872652 RepID=UPI001CC21FE7|nr:M23 family metallopeptidase [Sphingomonas nostoxanthinifaciens]
MTIRSIFTLGLAAVAAITAVAQPTVASPIAAPQKGDHIAATPDAPVVNADEDGRFHSLFMTWKRLDTVQTPGAMAVPSSKPLTAATFTSSFGVRSDPFRGSAAMHAGIDLSAPLGTPVYATADGMIDRAEWSGGYGNMVEVDHGKGLQTRFGHLSRILVHPGEKVTRGMLIGLVGSTGRSTGNHLHYEVRIDGHAVNPIPFLQSADYVTAMEARSSAIAMGGPDDANDDVNDE